MQSRDLKPAALADLIGLTLDEVFLLPDYDYGDIVAILAGGRWFAMHHEQDCCERVGLDGDAPTISASTRGAKIMSAREEVITREHDYGTFTATFYHIVTDREDIALTWRGESNGYYSEAVSFAELPAAPPDVRLRRSLFEATPCE